MNIEIQNKRGIKLIGEFNKTDSDILVLYIHGLAGVNDELSHVISNMCERNNISFCFARNQGYGEISRFDRCIGQEKSLIDLGSCYEDFSTVKEDIDCFVQYFKMKKYNKIYLVGHSLGNNKILEYLNATHDDTIKGVVLTAPQDMWSIIHSNYHLKMYDEAKYLTSLNKGNEILSDLFMGFCKMSAKTLVGYFKSNLIKYLPYRSKDLDWEVFRNIKVPKLVLIGEYDQGLDLTEGKTAYDNMAPFNYDNIRIIKDAKHVFKHHEEEVAEIIVRFVLENE